MAELSKTERDKRIAVLLEFHRPVFERLGIKDPAFYCKTPFKSNRNGNSVQEDFVSLYEQELTNTQGFFMEFTASRTYEPMEPVKRTLWKWVGNDQCKQVYHKNTQYNNERWFVPVAELIKVHEYPEAQPEPIPATFADVLREAEDAPFSKLTIRDYIAIHHKKPVSSRDWLNKIIEKL